MPTAFEQVAKDAIKLPRAKRLVLAGLLLELDEIGDDAGAEAAWEEEIRTRIEAVDRGTTVGVPFKHVIVRLGEQAGHPPRK